MLNKWFRHRLTIMAFLIPIVIILAFIYGLIPGFHSAANSQDQMRVAIVNNDDNSIANSVVHNLKNSLPVKKVITNESLTHVQKKLSSDDLSLVIVLPKSFSKNVQQSQPIHLKYYTSAAANTVEQSATTSAINNINAHVKDVLQSKVIIGLLAHQMAAQAQQQRPAGAMQGAKAAAMQKQMQQTIMKRASQAANKATVHYSSSTHQVGTKRSNKEYQMAGMFMSMGQYLGLVLASAVLIWLFSAARFSFDNKYKAFGTVQLTGLVMTFILSLITAVAARTLIKFSFGQVWMFNWLVEITFFEFTTMWSLLCNGLPSLVIQIPLFTTQVIAGGGILPQFAMPKFYQWLGTYTPMHSAMQGNMHLIHNIGMIGSFTSSLWWIFAIALVASCLILWIGYRNKKAGKLASLVPFN